MIPLRVALIGAGKHGERYLRHIAEDVPDLRVSVLCRRDAEAGRRQAEAMGARFIADFREAATSPEIDAVIAVVPPTLNPEICTLAAGAGKAILVEKPLAVSVAAGREIRRVIETAGVPFMVAHTLRFNQVARALHERLGEIGTVTQLCLSQRFEPSRLGWLDDRSQSGGGIILHTGVHSFDLLRFLAGRDPATVLAFLRNVTTAKTEDSFVAAIDFPGPPLLASVAGSRSTASRSGWIEICGERGQLCGDHALGFAYRVEGTKRTTIDPGPEVPTVREALRAFARALRSGEAPPITLEDGLWAVAMAEACYRSAVSGAPSPISVASRKDRGDSPSR